MLFVHLLRQQRIDICDGDHFKRPPFAKQSIEEWPHGTAAVFNGGCREASLSFHKASESRQHLVIDLHRFGWNLETVEKG
jgi:hypothetical protein